MPDYLSGSLEGCHGQPHMLLVRAQRMVPHLLTMCCMPGQQADSIPGNNLQLTNDRREAAVYAMVKQAHTDEPRTIHYLCILIQLTSSVPLAGVHCHTGGVSPSQRLHGCALLPSSLE